MSNQQGLEENNEYRGNIILRLNSRQQNNDWSWDVLTSSTDVFHEHQQKDNILERDKAIWFNYEKRLL